MTKKPKRKMSTRAKVVAGVLAAIAAAGGLIVSEAFLESDAQTIIAEGGYVNDPSDRGGATNYGITIHTARRYGYRGPMRDLPPATAIEIRRDGYWIPVWGDSLDQLYPSLASQVYDVAINMGPYRAVVFLQRCLNFLNNQATLYRDVSVDGVMGPATWRAAEAYHRRRSGDGEGPLMSCVGALQGAKYIAIGEASPSQERFAYGWLRRVRSKEKVIE